MKTVILLTLFLCLALPVIINGQRFTRGKQGRILVLRLVLLNLIKFVLLTGSCHD